MPSQMAGDKKTRENVETSRSGEKFEMGPICFMPRLRSTSPNGPKVTISTRKRNVFTCIPRTCSMRLRIAGDAGAFAGANRRKRWHGNCGLAAALPASPLPAFGAKLQESGCLVIEALAFVGIPQRFANDAPGHSRAEIISIIKAV